MDVLQWEDEHASGPTCLCPFSNWKYCLGIPGDHKKSGELSITSPSAWLSKPQVFNTFPLLLPRAAAACASWVCHCCYAKQHMNVYFCVGNPSTPSVDPAETSCFQGRSCHSPADLTNARLFWVFRLVVLILSYVPLHLDRSPKD